jgi:biofilm PGA synthesis lipoprotein PgaB
VERRAAGAPARRGRLKRTHSVLAAVAAGLGLGTLAYLVAPASAVRLPIAAEAPPAPAPPAPPAPAPEAPTGLFEGHQAVPVLMYHDIVAEPGVYFDVSVAEFRQHLALLKEAGANVIPLADLYDHMRHGRQLPPRAVVLTFDDGYAGQYRHAYPLLKKAGYPATFFVPTGTVGVRTSRDHMTWPQLQAMDREGLVTIEAHTISHPEDLRKLADGALERELRESKRVLEEKLARRVRFLAYPLGNADSRVARAAHAAGYSAAFTMGPGWTHAPADAFLAPRLYEGRIREVCARLKAPLAPWPTRSAVVDLRPQPLETGVLEDGQVRLRWIRGGVAAGARVAGRQSVPDLMRRAAAPAGLNGTFFSDARVNSVGAGIVGPVLSTFGPGFAPGLPGDRERVAGRPLVVLSPTRLAFLPFQPHLALDEEGVRRLIPDAADCFIAGAWLVHQGRALDGPTLERFKLDNVFDLRPRAVFGVDNQGRPFLGAAHTGNASDRLAESLVKLGIRECVLLDSGFSTSLVLGQEVLVSGIVRADMPARPVPHALLLYPADPATGAPILARRALAPGLMGPPDEPDLERLRRRFAAENAGPPAEAAPEE